MQVNKLPWCTDFISCLMLGLWDNTCGPRIDTFWEGDEPPDKEMRLYAVRLSLSGEIGQPPPAPRKTSGSGTNGTRGGSGGASASSAEAAQQQQHQQQLQQQQQGAEQPVTKFNILEDLDVCILSTLFKVGAGSNCVNYTWIMIFACRHLPRFYSCHDMIIDRCTRISGILRALLDRRLPASYYVPHLLLFLRHIDTAFNSRLPVNGPSFASTVFWGSDCDPNLLCIALTAHLQACGGTVVIGSSPTRVNQLIETLSCFLTGIESQRSSYARPNSVFTPDLYLQGIICPPDVNDFVIPEQRLMQGMLPTAVIDLRQDGRVMLSPFVHEYSVMRREFVAAELQAVLQSASGGAPCDPSSPPPSPDVTQWKGTNEPLFKVLKRAAPWVERLFAEVFTLPLSLREGFVRARMDGLKRMAITLIKYVEWATEEGIPFDDDLISRIKGDILGVHSGALPSAAEYDFLIILGYSEKIKKGIYTALAGDPDLLEEKFVELFESF